VDISLPYESPKNYRSENVCILSTIVQNKVKNDKSVECFIVSSNVTLNLPSNGMKENWVNNTKSLQSSFKNSEVILTTELERTEVQCGRRQFMGL
jgi:hypothetical protein